MSNANYTYSKFGSIYTGAVGGQGAAGAGFTVDSNGNYDIGGKKLVDVNEIVTAGIDSTGALSIQSNGTERINIPSSGIALDNTATSVLALSSAGAGTTLVYKNNILDADSPATLTNKTISATDNTITVNLPFDGDTNLTDIIDQRLTTLSSVDFSDVTTIGGVFAGGAGQFSQVITAQINDAGAGNTTTINGVNPLTTANTLAANVNQDVRTTASPSFVSETLSNQLTLNTGAFHPIIVNQSSNTSGNDILFQKNSVNIFSVGTNETTLETYTWTPSARDYKIGTNNTERLRILSTGIGNDNSITNVLGLNGTTLVYKNNLADTSSVQTFTNKTLTAPVISTISNSGTLTLPTGPDTLVARASTDTLTNKTLTLPVIASINNGGTVTLPTGTRTLVARDTTDTLTNKTLTLPIISSISNTGTLTLPVSTDTLVGRDTTDILTNKSVVDSSFAIIDVADNTKRILFNAGGTTGTSTTLICTQTTTQVLSLPNGTATLVSDSASQTLTNKTLTAPVISTISNTGTLTLPTSTDTLVGRATTDTLTNKTLTLPVIASISNAGTVTLPTGTRTLVARDTTDTLTNKTINSTVNTVQVNGTAIDSLINQDLRTTASPTHAALSLTNGLSTFGGVVTEFKGTLSMAAGAATTTFYALATASNKTYISDVILNGLCTSSSAGNTGKGIFQRSLNGITNNAGTLALNIAFGNSFATNGIGAGQTVSTSGTTANHGITSSALDAVSWTWVIKIYVN